MLQPIHLRRTLSATALLLTVLAGSRAFGQPLPASPGPGEPIEATQPLPPLGPLPTGLVPPSTVVAPPAPITMPLTGAPGAPSFAKSSWEIELSGSVGSTSFSTPASFVASNTSTSGQGTLEATRFTAPVVDDDAPRTLQPFLQRASTVSAFVTTGGFFTRLPGNDGSQTDVNVTGGLSGDVYVTRFLALSAGFSYKYDDLQAPLGTLLLDESTNTFSPFGGVGVRIGDARIDLSYTASILTSGGPNEGNWGTVALSGELVVDRRLYLHAIASAFHAGAGIYAGAEYYVTKDVGVFVDGLGSAGAYTNQDSTLAEYGFNVGVGFWPIPRLRLVAEYELTGSRDSPFAGAPVDGLDNAAYVSALVRLP